MTCNFDGCTCSVNCPKYNICMYFSLQKQITELTEQINLLMTILSSQNSYVKDSSKKGTTNDEN